MSDRPFTNSEIQEKISMIARKLSDSELDKFRRKDYSKLIFDINFPLFLKVPDYYTYTQNSAAVKDEGGLNRCTWKYEFQKEWIFLRVKYTVVC